MGCHRPRIYAMVTKKAATVLLKVLCWTKASSWSSPIFDKKKFTQARRRELARSFQFVILDYMATETKVVTTQYIRRENLAGDSARLDNCSTHVLFTTRGNCYIITGAFDRRSSPSRRFEAGYNYMGTADPPERKFPRNRYGRLYHDSVRVR